MADSCLLIAPKSFGILEPLIDELKSLGYLVTFIDDRDNAGFVRKFVYRFNFLRQLLISKIGCSYNDTKRATFDLLIVINGEGYSNESLLELARKSEKSIFYTWDSVKNKKFLGRRLRIFMSEFDSVGTFDPEDALSFNVKYVPLFGVEFKHLHPSSSYMYSFVGTVHSDRMKKICNFMSNNPGVTNKFVYFYAQSVLHFIIYAVLNIRRFRFFRKHVHLVPLPFEEYQRVTLGSDYVLDIPHPGQTGLTHRVVTCLVNKKIVVSDSLHEANKQLDGLIFVPDISLLRISDLCNSKGSSVGGAFSAKDWLKRLNISSFDDSLV